MRAKGKMLLFVLLWLGVGNAWAEGEQVATPQASAAPVAETVTTPAPTELRLKAEPVHNDGSSMGAASAQMVLGLGMVLAVIFALAWLAKRFNVNGTGTGAGMRVVGALALGPKEKLLLVEVDGKRLLLGVTAQQISLLQTSDATSLPESAEQQPGEFASKIQALLKMGPMHEK